jgi:H+/Cl- antiporter ClcA
METRVLIFVSVICILAGIVFAISILLGNKDKYTGKIAEGWWIPAIGFFLLYAVVLPTYFFTYNPDDPSIFSTFLEASMYILLAVSCVSWIIGKIASKGY